MSLYIDIFFVLERRETQNTEAVAYCFFLWEKGKNRNKMSLGAQATSKAKNRRFQKRLKIFSFYIVIHLTHLLHEIFHWDALYHHMFRHHAILKKQNPLREAYDDIQP